MLTTADHRSLEHLVPRIWQRDVTAFLAAGAAESARASVLNRLGWLDAPATMTAHVDDVMALRDALRNEGLTDVYLLGMGGSSLCAEVLRELAPSAPGVRLVVLDTTDEHAIRQATAGLNAAASCFIVASKSGSTIEVTSLERHFWRVLEQARGAAAGRHFLAITDPDTSLVRLAAERGYRQTFVNPPDIGGRFSALSLFGLIPAALVGWDPARLLSDARAMAELCRGDHAGNPGLALGSFMADAAAAGRDKLTILLPGSMSALGSWIEQLVAESTGKQGRGVLPVVGEPLGDPAGYGHDRAFVITAAAAGDAAALALAAAGHPVLELVASDRDVAREFFRWEFATAVAGARLGVNPFDEPNVRTAKDRTGQQLETRRRAGRFLLDPALEPGNGFQRRMHQPSAQPSGDRYIALLDYLPADPVSQAAVEACRSALRAAQTSAVTLGVGPRYLHSTGQYHKGGPNTGVFVLLTADDRTETAVPGTDYSFSALKQAQALGDFDALAAAGRHVIHYHLTDTLAGFAAAQRDIVARLTR